MLVLKRKRNETVQIGENITITIRDTHRGYVRIGITAPPGTEVVRGELLGENDNDDISDPGSETVD